VQERVAIGTAGVVYRAVQTKSRTEVTFKVLSPTATHPLEPARVLALRWRLEALQHPVIASLIDAYEDPEGFVIVTSWMGGGMGGNDFPLKTRKLTKQDVRLVAMRLCAALLAGEQQRFPHGDIKPSNVILANRGQQGLEVQIQDWGLSACREQQPSESLHYMAPERHHGHPASVQGDLFSAGATLWFLLTGEAPTYGDTPEEVLQTWGMFDAGTLAQLRPDLDEHFQQWLAWLLRWQPGDRPQSVSQALDVLTDVLGYAAAVEANTTSAAVPVASPASTPATAAAAPAPAPAPQQAAPAPRAAAPAAPSAVASRPAAPSAPAKPVAARPSAASSAAKPAAPRAASATTSSAASSAAKPAAPRAGSPRLQLPVASAAPSPSAEPLPKKTTDKPAKKKMNNGQRAMATVMTLCVVAGIGIAFVAWAEDHYGPNWKHALAKSWGGMFSSEPAATPAPVFTPPPPKPKPVVATAPAKPPPSSAKRPNPAPGKPAAPPPAASANSAPPKPFAVDELNGTGDLQGRTEGSGWQGPWQAQGVSLDKTEGVFGKGAPSTASRPLGTLKNLANDFVAVTLMVTHPGKDGPPLKFDILSADGATLVAPVCVAFEDGKVHAYIEGAETKIDVPAGKPFRLFVRWDWKKKKAGGKRDIVVATVVNPPLDLPKILALPISKRTLPDHVLPAHYLLVLHCEGAPQPVKISDVRVGHGLRDVLPDAK
jgi:hypothetical protein